MKLVGVITQPLSQPVNTVGTDIDENGNPVCVKMYDRDYIGKWYTHPCDHQAQYVCEYPRTGYNNPDPPTTVDPTVSL